MKKPRSRSSSRSKHRPKKPTSTSWFEVVTRRFRLKAGGMTPRYTRDIVAVLAMAFVVVVTLTRAAPLR